MNSIKKPLILIVDDNQDISFHLKLILEDNSYRVETAKNGLEALELLSNLTSPPDLIISDIMMPIMDGYEFFSKVSENLMWNLIPFIFLTAKTTPEDIRLGKMLGVDDYLTKPFMKEDLIAIIHGKIERSKKTSLLDVKVTELLTNLNINQKSMTKDEISEIILLYVEWDDKIGPKVKTSYCVKNNFPFSIDKIGSQLFLAANFIYGYDNINHAQGLLLNIENIKRTGYLFFDSIPDSAQRAGEKQYGLIIIAPKINYLQSLRIRGIFEEISQEIKDHKKWDIKLFWKKIASIFTTSII